MTGPEQAPEPAVTTAPAEGASSSTASPRAPLGRRRLPPHIGPARTSTVLLAIAFVAIGLLYLYVKPPETRTAGVVTDPASTSSRTAVDPPTAPAPAPVTPPEETPAPEETDAPEETAPTSEATPTSAVAPEESTAEESAAEESVAPTTPEGTTSSPAPETSEAAPTTAAPTS